MATRFRRYPWARNTSAEQIVAVRKGAGVVFEDYLPLPLLVSLLRILPRPSRWSEGRLQYYCEKYSTPDRRSLDGQPIPECLSAEEYANVDVANHRFHHEVAVPWLARVFDVRL